LIPLSSTTSRSAAVLADSPTSIRPPGNSQLPLSMRRTSKILPLASRTAANAAGAIELAAGRLVSW